MEQKKIHRGSDAYMVISLTNDGVRMDFSTMSDIMVAMYADNQKSFAGKCEVIATEGTSMRVLSPAEHQRFIGPYRLVLTCTFDGRTATYDAPAFDVVATSAEVDAQGMTTEQETSDIGIDLTVEDVSSSLVQEIVSAAVKATEEAVAATDGALTATDSANAAAALADEKASLANEKASLADEKATLANDAAGRVDGALEEYAEKITEQDAQIAKKVDKDGIYPDLTSGFADNLVGRGESVPAEFSFRASGGKSIKDGTARIKELRGNAVVWNQFYPTGWSTTREGITSTSVNGKISAIGTTTETFFRFEPFSSNIENHKYLFTLSGASSALEGKKFGLLNRGIASYSNVTQGFAYLFYLNNDASLQRNIGVQNISAGITLDEKLVVCQHDLTKMFGSGKEPTTIEEFYSRCPLGVDMNAYNEGEMIADNSTAIKSIGDNAWDEQWEQGGFSTSTGLKEEGLNFIRNANMIKVLGGEDYYIKRDDKICYIWLYDANKSFVRYTSIGSSNILSTPSNVHYINLRFGSSSAPITTYNNDITISLYHSGWKAEVDNVYKPYQEDTREIDQRILDAFPNGRKPWDKVYNKNGKGYIVKGTGEEDMGDLAWEFYGELFYVTMPLMKLPTTYEERKTGILSPRYSLSQSTSTTSMGDMCVMRYQDGMLYLKNSAYTDVASFKAAMAGVPLYYQLAEPTIIEYDEPFNLDYEVWDFGTEQAIAEAPSAPINANIIYQFNAVDMIRDHEARIAELEALIASLTNGGQ